mmetsp:Transcript_22380/g.70205  ORF Transcript_22380/g.70205 Transcript_22380/m.70205 type:complete len:429 (-) Transcript_22380:138-1424(-)
MVPAPRPGSAEAPERPLHPAGRPRGGDLQGPQRPGRGRKPPALQAPLGAEAHPRRGRVRRVRAQVPGARGALAAAAADQHGPRASGQADGPEGVRPRRYGPVHPADRHGHRRGPAGRTEAGAEPLVDVHRDAAAALQRGPHRLRRAGQAGRAPAGVGHPADGHPRAHQQEGGGAGAAGGQGHRRPHGLHRQPWPLREGLPGPRCQRRRWSAAPAREEEAGRQGQGGLCGRRSRTHGVRELLPTGGCRQGGGGAGPGARGGRWPPAAWHGGRRRRGRHGGLAGGAAAGGGRGGGLFGHRRPGRNAGRGADRSAGRAGSGGPAGGGGPAAGGQRRHRPHGRAPGAVQPAAGDERPGGDGRQGRRRPRAPRGPGRAGARGRRADRGLCDQQGDLLCGPEVRGEAPHPGLCPGGGTWQTLRRGTPQSGRGRT